MTPKAFLYLLAAASTIASVSAVTIPGAAPAPFVIPEDAEILHLRTDEDKALVCSFFRRPLLVL